MTGVGEVHLTGVDALFVQTAGSLTSDGEHKLALVCIGSPTRWLSANLPIRAFVGSDTAHKIQNDKPSAVAAPCRQYWDTP